MPDPSLQLPEVALPGQLQRIVINSVSPQVDGGAWAAKVVVDEELPVRACVFTDGQPALVVQARWRMNTTDPGLRWRHRRLKPHIDDFWSGNVAFSSLGAGVFQIEAWLDPFASWRLGYRRWLRAGQDPTAELETGVRLLRQGSSRLPARARDQVLTQLQRLTADPGPELQKYLLRPGIARLMTRALLLTTPERSSLMPVRVERPRALFGAWYEMFPRSEGSDRESSGTLATAAARLPGLAEMKFDIVYLPPIHPIGNTSRRGRNNSPQAQPGEPGSPWAIGAAAGGHTALHPDLGTLADFHRFRSAAEQLGLEIALDYALQCSPDHPWVTQHPEWFEHRPDGSIKAAENPPKRYDDVLPLDFTCSDWRQLWLACYEILEFWIGHGVRAFRVDNPHTKPVQFWAWLFDRLRRSHPEVIMLAEAFTRPALMAELSKVGFSQTYTYFTWRTTKPQLRSYLSQLTQETPDYLRPNFFANTPDILTRELQEGGPAAFRYRLALAATLSPSYGIYSGYELSENRPQSPGSEEYWDSEKYQYRPRDWGQPDSLAPLIAQLNQIRRQHPALQQLRRLRFHGTDNPKVLAYSKHTADRSDVVLVIVNLDPKATQRARLRLSWRQLSRRPKAHLELEELLGGGRSTWSRPDPSVTLDPTHAPALIYWVR
ncbi:MAG: maltotransferase domain-containing protein [Candidatus Dormibacteria bacterium]